MIQTFCGYTGLLNCLACLTFALFIYFKKRSGKVNRIFALWSLCVAFWSLGYYMWLFTPDYDSALTWSRILMAGAILIPATFLHFTLVYLDLDDSHRPVLTAGYVLSIAYLLLDFTPLFIESVEPRFWFRWWPVPGKLYHLFQLYFVAAVFFCQIFLTSDHLPTMMMVEGNMVLYLNVTIYNYYIVKIILQFWTRS